jgi:rubredoxin
MLHEGEGSSARKWVYIEGQSFREWGCSECGWVFHPYDPPVGKSLYEMKRNFQMQLSEEFASHSCRASSGVQCRTISQSQSGFAPPCANAMQR